jgi:hypothetical protein
MATSFLGKLLETYAVLHSATWSNTCDLLLEDLDGKIGRKLLFFLAYHPQTNGTIEVVNRSFSTLLLINKNTKN